MSELSAFLAGLILGDTSEPKSNKLPPKQKRNIALQDIYFLQTLANIVHELDEYVKASRPSPEEFIRYLSPALNFEEPYTEKEKKQIQESQKRIEQYVKRIDKAINSSTLLNDDGNYTSDWNSLSAIRMIWQDKTHTPDMKHLDLLLSNEGTVSYTPLKRDGRLYEYASSFPLYGLAQGYFESEPAKIIFQACINKSYLETKAAGFYFDNTRFDYDHNMDKQGLLPYWRAQQREKIYRSLKASNPQFFSISWSDYCEVFNDENEHSVVSTDEQIRRKKEITAILHALTEDEQKKMKAPVFSRLEAVLVIAFIITLIATIATAIIVSKCQYSLDWLFAILISLLFVEVLPFGILEGFKNGNKMPCEAYLSKLQAEYYEGKDTIASHEYAELLKRI